jgi:hypothetical protein
MADDRGPPVVLPSTGTCVFRFFKPTLHCDSWIPSMGVLLVLVGTTVVVLLIVYVL